MRTQKKRLSAVAFDLAAQRVSMSDRRIALARRYLVDGTPQKEIANDAGLQVPAVAKCVQAVWQAHLDNEELAPGMVRVTAVLPEDKAAIVTEWEKQAQRQRQRP